LIVDQHIAVGAMGKPDIAAPAEQHRDARRELLDTDGHGWRLLLREQRRRRQQQQGGDEMVAHRIPFFRFPKALSSPPVERRPP